ncbi:TPA: hypothetical protein ACS70C_003591 [Providencia alcalifaciens]
MILFAEPSAYALVFIPTYTFYIYRKSNAIFITAFSLSLLLSITIQNLTLLAGTLIATLLIRRINLFYLGISIVILALLPFIINNDISYFTERIDFHNSNNLSTLVYLSGIERAWLNLIDTWGIGVGFQQMGINNNLGESQYKLITLGFGNLNLYDGSFIASKFISEFGILALLALSVYVFTFFKLSRYLKNDNHKLTYEVIFIIYYLTFFIPLFLRGSGYINPYSLMFLSSALGLFITKKSRQ